MADTGNDRLCVVTLLTREEIRQERRKQAMVRRQMRAIERMQRQRANSASSDSGVESDAGDIQDDEGSDSQSASDSDSDSDSEDPSLSSGPFVGHVESVRVRGMLPPSLDANFIAPPRTPWTRSSLTAANGAVQEPESERAASSLLAACSSSVPAASSSSLPAASSASPLTPLPFVHRGQHTFLRKLAATSQGRILALSRLGLQVYDWRRTPQLDE